MISTSQLTPLITRRLDWSPFGTAVRFTCLRECNVKSLRTAAGAVPSGAQVIPVDFPEMDLTQSRSDSGVKTVESDTEW